MIEYVGEGREAPETDASFHSDLCLLAEPDLDLVQHLQPGCPERRGLEVQKGTGRPDPALHPEIQHGTGSSLQMDVYRKAVDSIII